MLSLSTPLSSLGGIGPALTKKLAHLGVVSVRDLLFYFPWRYEDFSKFIPAAEAQIGASAAVQGTIRDIRERKSFRRRIFVTEAIMEDRSGAIRAVWFNQPWVAQALKKNANVALAGKVYEDKRGAYLGSPAYEIIDGRHGSPGEKNEALLHVGRLVPVYPETAGLTSRWFRVWIKKILPLARRIGDPLPQDLARRQGLPQIRQAIEAMHFPASGAEAERAKRRFAFEDIFLLQLLFLREQSLLREKQAWAVPFDQALAKSFVDSLPWRLTDDQRKAAWQILQDIGKTHPMQRLLEGDVGSGKTVVSFLAVLEAVKAGYQAALMAPTEILARQHAETAAKLLGRFNVRIALLTGSEAKTAEELKIKHRGGETGKKRSARRSRALVAKEIEKGEVDFIIGTHALLQRGVHFKRLALAIVDEQHRFGIRERSRFRSASAETHVPHLLSMSATPIPRTLALTVYGDLDISLLKDMPPGRKPIVTEVVQPTRRGEAYRFIRDQVGKGRQAFVICPRIETNDKQRLTSGKAPKNRLASLWSEVKAVKDEYEKLSKTIFPDLRIGMLHGKMTPKEKERTMKDFAQRKTDILVSTSVVEVGVDIPNASMMVIESADRFGLASLHQFRGRIGRGPHQSYCLLFSDSAGKETNARLEALIRAKNGFELAERDLAIRGPGEFLGEEQSGIPDIAMEALKDRELVEAARLEAHALLSKDGSARSWPMALTERLASFHKKVHPE